MKSSLLQPQIDGVASHPRSALRAPRLILVVEIASSVLLLAIVSMLLAGVVSRYFFNNPIVWIDEAASIAFLWFAMLGAVVATHRSEHLRLTVVLKQMSERQREIAETFGTLLVLTFLVVLLPSAYRYAVSEMDLRSAALDIPVGYRVSAIGVGFLLIVLLILERLRRMSKLRDVLPSMMLIGGVVALSWLTGPAFRDMGDWNILVFLVGGAALCLALGVPIAFCFGIATLTFLTFTTSVPLTVIVSRVDEGMSSLILLSVPIFVLLGCILDATGMGKAIVNFLVSVLGHVKAGMSYVLLTSLFVVSGISGSKVSDMATVAPALFPEMKRRGYKPSELIAMLATGAAMADTVPPSIVLIVLGSVAGVSIAALFTSGFAIALVLLAALAILARFKARHEDMSRIRRATPGEVARAAFVAVPALVLPFLIRSAVASGAATATEVSTIAVLYAFIVGIVVYGGIAPKNIYAMFVDTAAMSGGILLILGMAAAFSWALTQTGFAFHLRDFLSNLPGGWVTFMLISIVLFLALGCVLEGLPAVVLLAPIMYPISRSFGIHDVQYSMVIVVAMNIGLMAPPIGVGFYIACKVGDVSPDTAMKAIWPYMGALVVGLLAVAFIPWLSIALL